MNENNANNSALESTVIVYGTGLSIHQDLADSVLQQVEEGLPYLLPDEKYTLKMICGDDYWSQLGNGEQRKVGQYISYLVDLHRLPLVPVKGKHEYPKLYKLR